MSSFTNPNHGPNSPTGQEPGGAPQSGLDQTRQQVDEVVDIMRNNVEKGKSLELLIRIVIGLFAKQPRPYVKAFLMSCSDR